MKSKIQLLKDEVAQGKWSKKSEKLWAGANLVITDNRSDNDLPNYADDRVIFTKYASELSALIVDIREASRSWVDCLSKYMLYDYIGKAIEQALNEGKTLQGVLLAALDAASLVERILTWRPYFAYGSNMDEEQMKNRCPSAELIGKATLTGFAFAIDSAGVATLLPNSSSAVEGLLWRINEEDERALDAYEGVGCGCYRKVEADIELDNGNYRALLYLSNRGANKGARRSGYLERIIRAAQAHKFSEDYLSSIREWSR